jgi:hypothetical protein
MRRPVVYTAPNLFNVRCIIKGTSSRCVNQARRSRSVAAARRGWANGYSANFVAWMRASP